MLEPRRLARVARIYKVSRTLEGVQIRSSSYKRATLGPFVSNIRNCHELYLLDVNRLAAGVERAVDANLLAFELFHLILMVDIVG